MRRHRDGRFRAEKIHRARAEAAGCGGDDKTSAVDALVSDGTFKFLFAYTDFDLDHLKDFDLDKLTDYVKNNVNSGLGSPGLANVGIAEFTFVPASDAKSATPPPQIRL